MEEVQAGHPFGDVKSCREAADDLGSGLIDQIQKMTMAAMAIADMNVWAQRSYRV